MTEVFDYLKRIADAVRTQHGMPVTWAHVVHACLRKAQELSAYQAERRLLLMQQALEKRVIDRLSGSSGLSDEQLAEAAARLEESEADGPASRFVHERILRWRSSARLDVPDWTVDVWTNVLRDFHVAGDDFTRSSAWAPEPVVKAEGAPPRTDWRRELNELVGLAAVKRQVLELNDFLHVQHVRASRSASRGKPVDISLHQIFTGNPGTGKTSVARILGNIYREFGYLKRGHLVEVSRADLVGAVIGATEENTQRKVAEALEGVLFIDEAYSLSAAGNQDFGPRAIDVLLKMMEDHRDEFVLIVAGYPDKMKEFLSSNPGLSSRFNEILSFSDYSEGELAEIFKRLAARHGCDISHPELMASVSVWLSANKSATGAAFGNARAVRNLWEKMLRRQAYRLNRAGMVGENEPGLDVLLPEDVPSDV
ncbi:putative AAA+ superfamily ATPase [Methylorubrum rhodinum]|uniref:Putative AAA+ superfamily ATPase n=1 Tax=Methylorubrum rhodinum TaxID=29428 RepID=A0A840ZSC4_9HYPH|nr:AAA family ATPase [Methylorubrum rhodinum]MBB5760240.1 putative AAA+ superfamily ATPase [Methylorubrum rhodinum]